MSVGHWLGNAVKSSGRLAGSIARDVSHATGVIERNVAKVPGVGPLFHGAFIALEGGIAGPFQIASGIASGKRIDRVLMTQMNRQLGAIKEIAPYAQSVMSFIPGIGTGVSAAMAAGLALASGKRLDQVLLAGISVAVPGGQFGKMAFDMGKAVMEHKPIADILVHAGADLSGALGAQIPDSAVAGITAGLHMAQGLAKGSKKHPVAQVDATMTAMAAKIPGLDPAQQKEFTKALQAGMAVGQAVTLQKTAAELMAANLLTFAAAGQEFSDGDPVTKAAQGLLPEVEGKRGFAVGMYAMVHQIGESDLAALRAALPGEAKRGFDLAVSLQIGRVTTPVGSVPEGPAALKAGYLITKGMLGATPDQKGGLAEVLAGGAESTQGSILAMGEVQEANDPWEVKLTRYFGLS